MNLFVDSDVAQTVRVANRDGGVGWIATRPIRARGANKGDKKIRLISERGEEVLQLDDGKGAYFGTISSILEQNSDWPWCN